MITPTTAKHRLFRPFGIFFGEPNGKPGMSLRSTCNSGRKKYKNHINLYQFII